MLIKNCLLWDQNLVSFFKVHIVSSWAFATRWRSCSIIFSLSVPKRRWTIIWEHLKCKCCHLLSSSLAWHFLIFKETQHKRIPFYYIKEDIIEQIIFNMSSEMGPLLSGQSSKPACNLLFKFIWGGKTWITITKKLAFYFSMSVKVKFNLSELSGFKLDCQGEENKSVTPVELFRPIMLLLLILSG